MARPEIEPKTPLGLRLREVRANLKIEDRDVFASQLGLSKGGLAHYERGERVPDASVLQAYRENFGINANWLLTGQGSMFSEEIGKDTSVTVERDFVLMPQYDVCASAGTGRLPVNQMPTSETAFERKFLRDLGGAPDHCFLMWSTGDSMLPSIPDNALLIVDASQTTVDHGRIYVFSVGNAVLVKRANWRMDGRLELISDNTAGKYPVETFDANRVEDLAVVGRVIFVGHPP
ncbi:helix-turn-helix domain-containing protein [Agrobacterium vitis]|uniref:Helix-turn-helix domain-containing protein n=1 Tax=Agrobacterium vitis TaxID=373 RepID=A0A368NEB7_AGRVI|nr:S24 family peptidase [Agrobacterium vitis]KAA3512590.1 helix-turn-helix domain-containing protein [Agrobacterium vitis]KAA3525958.1 helix-turn-helix domain-containing protein [Agrobacterium vitis]MUZ99090.1 helix-turn-helix domain-containing protein [Agrobacterium vitis]MVA31639.1 helix-turn-helix domain-containing protein [Agrobacterium vitis]NOJ33742.1 helix-turn-helix domain-containing protein [Agrobacterium vitis]